MNKGDLIESVASQLNESKAHATKIVDAVLEGISQGVQRDGKVTITGFGSFERKERAARTGINPATRQPIEIKASRTINFRPSQSLKESLNEATV
ncbi:MAG: HU family DNA-binding protein [Phycisphaeraceae bacterium]|nr:MAG: HU family DNA-binding protein [Phycisphaeraceae bacterium]